jgi:glycosyltransferase involved in cell wall biosynthesis
VLVPCYNEAQTIGQVIAGFRESVPSAVIYVYDNNSRDNTKAVAREAGAIVRSETNQGKGHVVRRMFSDIQADAYLLVDGDDTYDPSIAAEMVGLLLRDKLDMVVGRRVDESETAYRPGHRFGNNVLTGTVGRLFGQRCNDMLSGYRVLSRRFVKSFPVFTRGFEIETEMTVHALTLQMPILEIDTHYRERPAGSTSKLRTYRDGIRILSTIFHLFREERPLLFFSLISGLFALTSLMLAYPVIVEFLETGLVRRFPTAILATGMAILSALSLASAFILDTVTHGRRSDALLHALAIERWEDDGCYRAGG